MRPGVPTRSMVHDSPLPWAPNEISKATGSLHERQTVSNDDMAPMDLLRALLPRTSTCDATHRPFRAFETAHNPCKIDTWPASQRLVDQRNDHPSPSAASLLPRPVSLSVWPPRACSHRHPQALWSPPSMPIPGEPATHSPALRTPVITRLSSAPSLELSLAHQFSIPRVAPSTWRRQGRIYRRPVIPAITRETGRST